MKTIALQVFVDQQPLAVNGEAGRTLGEIVAEVRDRAASQGRMVLAIHCDGQEVDFADWDEQSKKPVHAFDRLDFITGAPSTFAREVLETAIPSLAAARDEQAKAISLLAEGRDARAMEILGGSVKLWRQAQNSAVQAISLIEPELAGKRIDPQQVRKLVDSLAHQLRLVKESLELRDYVTLADVLQYEFGPTTAQWEAFLSSVLAQLGDARSP